MASVLTLVLMALIGTLPLFGGPGYEAALAAGVVLPSLAAVTTAQVVVRRRHENQVLLGRTALGFGIACGSWLAAIAIVVSLLHGARVGFCDVTSGLWLMLLGPVAGAVVGGAWGALAGGWAIGVTRREASRRMVAALVALAGPFTGAAISVYNFYVSPAVFAFDPFFGYFAGPLYDTVIDPLERLASYRVGTLLSLLGAWVFAGFVRERSGSLLFRWDGRVGQSLAGGAALAMSSFLAIQGPELSHNTSEASVLEALSRRLVHGRCEIRYDPSIPVAYVELLGRDCQAHLAGLEDYFETRPVPGVRVLLFASAQQKGRLMGAEYTLIAKPLRREVYVHVSSHPHPILRHELAHVVAGAFADGPFRVAARLGGWLPDPGRIEGFAEAAAPREDSEFTVTEWTQAMLEVGLMPSLQSIFQLSFLGQNSSTAYTVAGAFVAWLKERYGAAALKAWYGGATLETVTGGLGLEELDSEFRKDLKRTAVSQRLRIAAVARFSAPSIFGRRCPHAVDQRFAEAQVLLGSMDIQGAEEAFEHVLVLDPDHVGARLGLGHCALRRAQAARALSKYIEVASDTRLAVGSRLGAREAIADTHFMAGDLEQARAQYDALIADVASEGHLRNLAVKRRATVAPDREREAITALLLGSFRQPPTWDKAAPLLGAWAEREPTSGLPVYLIAKNLFNRAHVDATAHYVAEALSRGIELTTVRREALRLGVIVACARKESAVVARYLSQFAALPDNTIQQLDTVRAIAGRCGVRPQ